MKVSKITAIFVMHLSVWAGVSAGSDNQWLGQAADPQRHSIALDGPNQFEKTWEAWECPADEGYLIDFEGQSSPAVYNGRIYAFAKYYDNQNRYIHNQIIAFDQATGENVWATIIEKIPEDFWDDSWSSPAIDEVNNAVVIASGQKVYSLCGENGAIRWQRELEKPVLNASACVVNEPGYSRVFITDFASGFEDDGKGRLYCIENSAGAEGEIIWSEVIGKTSGNTPAYYNGTVYVATLCGSVCAYRTDTADPDELWRLDVLESDTDGFFGGVNVTREGYIYAASYDWDGGEDNSTLCKIDAEYGTLIWKRATERTNSIPVVIGQRIFLSGGLDDLGSRSKLTAYEDKGDSVIELWQTPEEMIIGGWTHQPVYANGKIYLGAKDAGVYTDLYILDVEAVPEEEGFVIDHFSGAGGSPAVTVDSVYSIGGYDDGLFKFEQPRLAGDINADGQVGMDDLKELCANWMFDGPLGVKRSDLNLDGKIDFKDFAIFAGQWKKSQE